MNPDSDVTQSTTIAVRDFSVIMLWPVRVVPQGDLKEAWCNDNVGAGAWLRGYADYITANGPWELIQNYGTRKGRLHEPTPEDNYAEFLYFHPFIQKFLYADSAYPVFVLKHKEITGAKVQLREGGPVWTCDVERANLFLFPTNVGIAAVELTAPRNESHKMQFFLSDALDFLDYARRIYPPYFICQGPAKPGGTPWQFEWLRGSDRFGDASDFQCAKSFLKCTEAGRIPVAAHWRSLLQPLTPHGEDGRSKLRYEQVEDDRLPVCASVGVDDPGQISPADWVRVAFCDAHGDNSAKSLYSDFFVAKAQANYYDRFWDPANDKKVRFLLTDYSFIAVGQEKDWFYSNLIRKHIQQHYFLLCLLAHLQKSTLLGFWGRLSDMVHAFEGENADAAAKEQLFRDQQWLLQDLTDFVSRFYFHEVSNQLQATELFDMLREKLRIESLFREVKEQSEFVSRVLHENRQRGLALGQDKTAREQTRIAGLANWYLPLGLTTAILGMSVGIGHLNEFEKDIEKSFPGEWWLPWIFFLVVAALCLSFVLLAKRVFGPGTERATSDGGRTDA